MCMPDAARLRVAGLLLAALVQVSPAFAQPAPPGAPQAGRPRIGLALGGGSARGLAHIGVLEWFERHRVPIDVIAGTSVGGLIAGAYASGMTPAEIRELMRTTDWDLMFLADSPFRYKTFRRKQDARAFPSQLEVGLKGGLQFPGGLNTGQQVSLLLDRIAAPYSDLRSFDDLPTPFRCVATDLRRSEVIVLRRGSLARAMRATMAIPGVFTPVSYDDWLLVDGGTLNNIPADVVRAMGADVVIAVDVSADVAEEHETESMFSLLGRTIDAMMATSTRKALEAADLIVDPDLKGLGATDWRRSDELADRGMAASEARASVLRRHALDEAAYAAFMAARAARRRTTLATPEVLDVRGIRSPLSPAQTRAIERQFGGEVGRPMNLDRLADDVLSIAGTDRYEYLTFRSVERDGRAGLLVGARTKAYGPPFLAPGVDLSNVDSSNFALTVGGRVTTFDLAGAGSEARLDVKIGTRQRVAGEVYVPIGTSGFFVAPFAAFDRAGRNGYLNERFVAEYRIKRLGGGFDVGYTSGRRMEVRAGIEAASVRGRLRVGNPLLPEAEGAERVARVQVTWDGQTSPMVPTRGILVRGTLRRYLDTPDITAATFNGQPLPGNPGRFSQADVTGSWFHRAWREDRVFVGGAAGTSFGANPLFNDFALGGVLRLGAYNTDEVRGSHFAYLATGYLKQVARLPDVVGGNTYLGAWVETGSAWDQWRDRDWRNNVTAGVVVESLIGPMFAGGSVGSGRGRVYVAIGSIFR